MMNHYLAKKRYTVNPHTLLLSFICVRNSSDYSSAS